MVEIPGAEVAGDPEKVVGWKGAEFAALVLAEVDGAVSGGGILGRNFGGFGEGGGVEWED